MLDSNATIIERLLAPLREAIAKTPKPPTNDVERLLNMGVPRVQDFRGLVRDEKHKRGRFHGTRKVESIVGTTWHQTGTPHLGPGDPDLLSLPAHLVVHDEGTVTLLHDILAIVWHGHSLNKATIGVEVECREPGLAGVERTFWRSLNDKNGYQDKAGKWHPPKVYHQLVAPMTDVQCTSALLVGEWLVSEVKARGGRPDLRQYAHRQGRADRTSDPGERVWSMVVEPLRRKLDLPDASLFTVGSGTPIPDRWCGMSRGVGY